MDRAQMAEVLQELLIVAMERWNATHLLDRPLQAMPWEALDPVSRVIYIQRCEAFLARYTVELKYPTDVEAP